MPSLDFSQAWPWLQWVIAALAVVAFVAACVRGIPAAWRFLSRAVVTINALGDLPDELEHERKFRVATTATLEQQNKQLAVLKHEVLPNHGGSLRDAVDKHGTALAEVNEKLANDDTRINKLQARDEQGRFTKEES